MTCTSSWSLRATLPIGLFFKISQTAGCKASRNGFKMLFKRSCQLHLPGVMPKKVEKEWKRNNTGSIEVTIFIDAYDCRRFKVRNQVQKKVSGLQQLCTGHLRHGALRVTFAKVSMSISKWSESCIPFLKNIQVYFQNHIRKGLEKDGKAITITASKAPKHL